MKKLHAILLIISIVMVSCCWIPDTTCYPRIITQSQDNSIKYLTSCCDYNNLRYVNDSINKKKPKRFCFLDIFVQSDSDYALNKKNISIISRNRKIKKLKSLLGIHNKLNIYKGINMISLQIKSCIFINDTIDITIKNNDGDTLLSTSLLVDETFSEPYRLLGSDTLYIDSVWRESIRNIEARDKLPKHSSFEREAMEFTLKAMNP